MDVGSVCHVAAASALAVGRLWWPQAVYPDPSECSLFEPFGWPLLHVDPEQVWALPEDSGGGQTGYDVDTRVELSSEASGGRIVLEGRDMHILTATNRRINKKHVR